MGAHYLCSYKPLRYTSAGRNAIAKTDLPPFIDGSCRREPDFQAQAPSISAIWTSRRERAIRPNKPSNFGAYMPLNFRKMAEPE